MQDTKTKEQSLNEATITGGLMGDTISLPVKVKKRPDGQLWVNSNGKAKAVHVLRCFPWSEPNRYISLRDKDEDEVALVVDLCELETESRIAVEGALAEAGFVLEIRKVISLDEDFEIRNWKVQTAQGVRKFQTGLDDWPYEVPGGGLLIRDISGDIFFIRDPEDLDEESRKLVWAFIN